MKILNTIYHIEPFNGYDSIEILQDENGCFIKVDFYNSVFVVTKEFVMGSFAFMGTMKKKWKGFSSLQECEDWLLKISAENLQKHIKSTPKEQPINGTQYLLFKNL